MFSLTVNQLCIEFKVNIATGKGDIDLTEGAEAD
jgi:hypothetical protein